MNIWNKCIENFYLKNKNKIRKEKYKKDCYNYFMIKISNNIITHNFVICPVCGYLKSNISQHIGKHKLNKKSFYQNYPSYKLIASNYAKKAADNKIMSNDEKQKLSNRMKQNNPMKNLKTRKSVSETRLRLYKDPIFKNRMDKIRIENFRNMQKNGTFKVPGWGVSGYYNDIYFRSTGELKALIWFKNNNLFNNIECNYEFCIDNEHFFCDFKIGNNFYEIKDKSFMQDEREKKQLRIINKLKKKGINIEIWNSKHKNLKSITYINILEEYLNENIKFIESSRKYSLVRRLENEYNIYKKN